MMRAGNNATPIRGREASAPLPLPLTRRRATGFDSAVTTEHPAVRYRAALARLGISMREVGRLLGKHDTVARRWGMPERNNPPPPAVVEWLEAAARDPDGAAIVRSTLPVGWPEGGSVGEISDRCDGADRDG